MIVAIIGGGASGMAAALAAAENPNAQVLLFSMEMPREQLSMRMLSIESRVPLSGLREGDLTREDWEDLNIAVDRLSGAGIFIDDTPNISLAEMKNKCRRMRAERGLDLVVVH